MNHDTNQVELPDIAALYLDEALALLEEVGVRSAVHVEKTMQPREREADIDADSSLSYRVVRCEQREDEQGVILTVTAARQIHMSD